MTRMAFIRHATTAWNAARRIQGRSDVPLSERGRAEATAWTPPPEIVPWRWLASPLKRAVETATLLHGQAPPTDPRLVEMDYGEWEGRQLDDLRAEMGPALTTLEARGLDFRAPGGESPRDVQARVRPLLGELAADGRPTVVVAHKGVLRALYAGAVGWDMTGDPPDKLRDGCVHLFVVAGDGALAVDRLNMPLAARP